MIQRDNNGALPIPPFEMRQLVGPTDESAFENATGNAILDLPEAQFESVVDFGCGCGRLARQLIQQRVRPKAYIGFDIHPGMIDWCGRNLTPRAPELKFIHHDVSSPSFNPGEGKSHLLPMPASESSATLMLAWSVFTHTVEDHAEFYFREVQRVLRRDGLLVATFFMFEKRYFPMMQSFQNTLYINADDSSNATIFDREWLQLTLESLGLGIVYAEAPAVRGYQWLTHIRHLSYGAPVVPLPEDLAPFGRVPPPVPSAHPSLVKG